MEETISRIVSARDFLELTKKKNSMRKVNLKMSLLVDFLYVLKKKLSNPHKLCEYISITLLMKACLEMCI